MSTSSRVAAHFIAYKGRFRLFGLSLDDCIKVYFGGNAIVSIVVLALITIFLFREGAGFFGQNRENLTVYRQAGLEYVDIIRAQQDDHGALSRYLSDLRLRELHYLTGEKTQREQLLAVGKKAEADAVVITKVDFAAEVKPILGSLPAYREASAQFAKQLTTVVATAPAMPDPALQARMDRFKQLNAEFIAGFPAVEQKLVAWDALKPVPISREFTTFIFGRQWITASLWQDWYGVIPLLVGSIMVSLVALIFAVPLGVGAAIYVNQIATPFEQRFIKPCIEFISAIPSVVLGFFGIAVLGQLLRALSQVSWLSWVPGFPYTERLNILTAGCLLALIAVPTIFTLAEDALNNVPRAFKEASFALGATRLQTILRIIVPASLSGIISAVLLGLGRVIGETMVVLLCAGNRIKIPDFSAGLAVITQPVHTMTGIIAQETGEVAHGSIHWRALFTVGILLFFLSLVINYVAQGIVRRYRISIG